jgi:hypothetical protein
MSTLRKSCALTLAHKLKLKTASKVFSKFGKHLRTTNVLGAGVVTLNAYPTSLKTINQFKNKSISINLAELVYNQAKDLPGSYKQLPKVGNTCEFQDCKETTGLENHHVNPQVSIRRKDLTPFMKSLLARKRKRVSLCRKHHALLHRRRIFD